MPAPSQPDLRKFGDYDAVRTNVYGGALAAVQAIPPVENSRYKIGFSDVGYAGPAVPSLADHKQALVDGRSLSRRLTGTVTMTDKGSGATVDARRMTIASIPQLTQQGVFVLDGTAQPVAQQFRLMPGIYSRKKGNGSYEGHVNLLPGTGVPHRIGLDPETGVFKTTVNQAEIPTISLLKILGATPEELKHAWGEELYLRNLKADKPHHVDRYWEKMGPAGPAPDGVDKAAVLADRIGKYPLDPWVSSRTLGKPYDRYGKEPLLVTTGKLLDIARGHAEPDDRDDPIYSTVWGPEHLLAERLSRSGPLLSKLLWQATNTGGLKRVQPGFLTPSVRALFTKSGLALVPEGTSAAEFMDHGARITKIGEGGIGKSADSVPMSARDIRVGQFPFVDLARTSESESVGVDLRVAFGTRLGADKRIYAPLRDVKSNKLVFRSPQDLADKTLGFPSAMTSKEPIVPVIRGGKLTYAPKAEVDYVVPSMEQSFSPMTNLVPLKSAAKAHRGSMAARMITQSLPLTNSEAPLVRSQVPGQPGRSFEELYGPHMGAVFARKDHPGQVTDIGPGHIAVQYADGQVVKHERYDNMPSGRKTGTSTDPLVKVGDPVAPGQILAKSNYTDAKGHAAYGTNLRVGFMNLRNRSYEDAISVSESAAKKLTSDHLYRHDVYADDDVMVGKTAHQAAFPGTHTVEKLKSIEADGVVKPGTLVSTGDPLVLAVRRRQNLFGRLSRSGKSGLTDVSETWDHDEPGVVTDAYRTKNGPVVMVRTQKQLNVGDKLSGRHGNKGVSVIIPDHQMPVGEDGQPLEMVISSLGVVSRANPNSKYEALLGKIAAKTGQPYVVNDWDDDGSGKDVGAWVRSELARHGVKGKETLTDPETGRTIPGVLTGMLYTMKLHHTSAGKVKGRGLGGYDESGQPLRGQSGKAMRASLGDTNALLSHGATDTIHDAHIMRGQANDDFWLSYMSGYPPTRPVASKPFERFMTELRAAGIDPVSRDGRYHLTALTDARVNELAGDRTVANGETLDFSRNGEPVKDGLFDANTFGSPDSTTTWAKIPLHEPVINPALEEPTRRLLGLTEKQFRDTVAGRHQVGGDTGMGAVISALGKIDVPTELTKARVQAESSRKTVRDEAFRRLFYLKGLERTGQTPKDWVLNSVPVLPPGFRPVSAGGPGGSLIVSDANLLYSDVIGANHAIRDLSKEVADVGTERLNLYDAVKAVAGLGDPVGAKNRERGVQGVLGRLLGDTSKHSFVQQKLLGTPINLSGRGAVVPNPDLDLDQMGIPESMAKDIFHPFIIRRLVRSGMGRVDAAREVEAWGGRAQRALTEEMAERPVLATRYPVLHRYNVMAFHPQLVSGDAIQSNHLINKSFSLDHDGDTMTISVPLSDEAVKEAHEKLLPSRNLYSPATYKPTVYTPNMEITQGLHSASTEDDNNHPVEFQTRAEAIKAYLSGQLRMGTRVRIHSEG